MSNKISIAIDGPSGAGKSSLAKKLAAKLGFVYVDTGALYRTVAYYCIQNGIDVADVEEVASVVDKIHIEIIYINGEQHVLLNGTDVNSFIRTPQMAMGASAVSAQAAVRTLLYEPQRSVAEKENIVMDGRDVGTVILPSATVKIYLTATVEDRAQRRYLEHIARGEKCSLDEIREDIRQRDYNDTHRKLAPLKKADDAFVLDNTGYEEAETLSAAEKIINSVLKGN